MFDDSKCFFYITNDWDAPAEEIVFDANDRCDQENLIAQHKSGVRSLTAPVDNLESNWAYMVMAGLAWSLKAWAALLVVTLLMVFIQARPLLLIGMTVKASLIGWVFMHLRYERRDFVFYVVGSMVISAAILFGLIAPDGMVM